VEALQDLQKAIELNDNRAVYRSRLLLDRDEAARSAALGRIYNDLGFQELGLVEGWKSVNTNPSNYSAHRLLADNYAALPRHEIARVSELLQSQLLQPLNITPVQPNLGESNLPILEGSGPSNPSFNEFNPLFTRNRLALQASGVVGDNDTLGDEVTQSGVWGKFSYSLGQFHFQTDGFRENNDVTRDVYDLFAQIAPGPNTSLQTELRYSATEEGDREFKFDPADFSSNLRRDKNIKSLRFGLRHSFSLENEVIGSIVFRDLDESFSEQIDLDFDGIPLAIRTVADTKGQDYLAEIQHLFRSKSLNLTGGVGHTGGDRQDAIFQDSDPLDVFDTSVLKEPDFQHTNLYTYGQLSFLRNLRLVFGASADFLKVQGVLNANYVNPKLGLFWTPTINTTVRLAAFRVIKRPLVTNQTIEPTQVAGFNQFFDDFNGTRAWRYGLAVDQKLSPTVYGGLELSARSLTVPFPRLESNGADFADWDEQLGRGYLYWAPTKALALRAGYEFERIERDLVPSNGFRELKTHRAPLGLSFFHPRGISVRLDPSFVHQLVDFGSGQNDDKDTFWVMDAGLSYRLPNRRGILGVTVKNLFDQHINIQQERNPINRSDPAFALERQFLGTFTLSF